ncbi:MAG: VWA domain-containing protein [Terriglobales bacterium]
MSHKRSFVVSAVLPRCVCLMALMVFCGSLASLGQSQVQTQGQTSPQTSPAVSGTQAAPAPATPAQGSAAEPPAGVTPAPSSSSSSEVPKPPTPPPADTSQAETDQDSGVFVFKKRVEEVILHATVVDEQQHLVPDLDRSAFSVFESGVPQTITSFHREDVPVAMGIVIDNSGSMRDKRNKVNEAVLNLIRQSNPGDQIFVVNFSQDGYLDQDFTSDVNLVRGALQRVSMRGSTALYDAIVASAIHLKNNRALDNQVLLVITDGRDNDSRETLREARLRLQQQNGPTLYAIGLLGDGIDLKDQEILGALAGSTGGAAFFPRSLDELDSISRAIGHDIRSRYTIGYKSSNERHDSGYRAIRVEAQSRTYRQLKVRTRTGYYPGESVR